MRRAVDLDGEAGAWAEEVDDEGADRVLTSETQAVQLTFAQRGPEARLGRGQLLSERASVFDRLAVRVHRGSSLGAWGPLRRRMATTLPPEGEETADLLREVSAELRTKQELSYPASAASRFSATLS